ncbi:MAG: MerR family transcriptional regulator [Georgenia sp.]
MRIGELAREGGVNPKTIRYYESIGLLPEPDRTASGYRDYEPSDLARLTFIRSAKRLGISLDEIREILAFQQRGEARC